VLTRDPSPARLADVNSELHSQSPASQPDPALQTPPAALPRLTGWEMFLAALTGSTRGQQLSLRQALARPSKHAKGWKSSRSVSRKRASRRAMEHATRKANRGSR
jgi:hypothetical protein